MVGLCTVTLLEEYGVKRRYSLTPTRDLQLPVRRHRAHCFHRNIDRGSILGGGDGSWDEPISRAKGR